jgi:hypothetical protein
MGGSVGFVYSYSLYGGGSTDMRYGPGRGRHSWLYPFGPMLRAIYETGVKTSHFAIPEEVVQALAPERLTRSSDSLPV